MASDTFEDIKVDEYQKYVDAGDLYMASWRLRDMAKRLAGPRYPNHFHLRTFSDSGLRYEDWSSDEILAELESLEQHITGKLHDTLELTP